MIVSNYSKQLDASQIYLISIISMLKHTTLHLAKHRTLALKTHSEKEVPSTGECFCEKGTSKLALFEFLKKQPREKQYFPTRIWESSSILRRLLPLHHSDAEVRWGAYRKGGHRNGKRSSDLMDLTKERMPPLPPWLPSWVSGRA